MSSDAKDITTPDAGGMARAMKSALRDASLNTSDIHYINAHGTGTRSNDATETKAIKLAFDGAAIPPLSSSKSMFGHALGGAGALEMVATVLAMKHQIAPPTIGFVEKDPECDLDVIPNTAREMKIDAAISNSFAFGGLNAVLAVKRVN
jgi:nodulation protein E